MAYTQLDALYDVLVWQFPVPFVIAFSFVSGLVANHAASSPGTSVWWCPTAGCGDLGLWMCVPFVYVIAWTAVAMPIILMDLVLMAPIFALIRYTETVRLQTLMQLKFLRTVRD